MSTMSLYLDHEFEAETLDGVLQEAVRAAREAWFRQIEWEVELSYRDLAKVDVRAGRSDPKDHPSLAPGVFVDEPFDLTSTDLVDLWSRRLSEQVSQRSVLGVLFKP